MNAIEFQTTITNSFVQIPNYEEFENKQVKIIVIDATPTSSKKNTNGFIHQYSENPVSINDDILFLTRDEANER